jgi:hypothetical protein
MMRRVVIKSQEQLDGKRRSSRMKISRNQCGEIEEESMNQVTRQENMVLDRFQQLINTFAQKVRTLSENDAVTR